MISQDVRVCPRCGEPAGEERFCTTCGLNLAELTEVPTRAEWERAHVEPRGEGRSREEEAHGVRRRDREQSVVGTWFRSQREKVRQQAELERRMSGRPSSDPATSQPFSQPMSPDFGRRSGPKPLDSSSPAPDDVPLSGPNPLPPYASAATPQGAGKAPKRVLAGVAVVGLLVIVIAVAAASGLGGSSASVPASAQICALGQSGGVWIVVQGADAGQDCNDFASANSGWNPTTTPPAGVTNWIGDCEYVTPRQNIADVYFQQAGPEGVSAVGACGAMHAMGWQEQ